MEDICKNAVKNKRKEKYVKFYYELAQSQDELFDDGDDDNSDNRDY